MIEIKHLAKTFSNHEIFNDINLKVNTGEILAIIGPSGSGKSTLLRCLNLLEKPDEGEVTIGDSHFTAPNISKKQAVGIRQESTMVFQQFNLFRQKTAWQNVAENLITVKKVNKVAAKQRALEELDKVGLGAYANFYPGQLSGGQKQRVAIARSLSTDSKILLLDEPTSALDSELVGEVLTTLRAVVENHPDYTVNLVSHELEFVKEVATKVIFFESGQIIESGTPEEVLNNPQQARTQRFLSRFTQQAIAQ